MLMTFAVEFTIGAGGTLMARTFYNETCIVEDGRTFEEAEKRLIESVKKMMLVTVPTPKTIEINL